jgi:hypothetical protein
MIRKLFKKKPDKELVSDQKSKHNNPLYPNMDYEKYGYIGRGILPYYFNYQDLHFKGTGLIICKCDEIKELNFEILCTDKLDLTCKKSNDNYVTTFYINDKIVYSCRTDPNDLTIYFEKSLTCEKTNYVMVDH